MRNAFAIVLAGAMLAACGQRGALYLPEEQREQVGITTPAAASSPTPEADADEREANVRRNRGN
jgi:predicted small lipoprotein YifL